MEAVLVCAASFHQILAMFAAWIRVASDASETVNEYAHNQELQHTARALMHVRKMLIGVTERMSDGLVNAGKI